MQAVAHVLQQRVALPGWGTRAAVAAVSRLVAGIPAGEELEAEDIRSALAWLNRTDDVFRRVKPATPDRHLVSYVVRTSVSI